MARKARAVAVGCPHHVTRRGNGRADGYFSGRDREVYLDTFFDYAGRNGLRVCGYRLVSNHVHFVAAPKSDRSLARVSGGTHRREGAPEAPGPAIRTPGSANLGS
jgi:putative transposase